MRNNRAANAHSVSVTIQTSVSKLGLGKINLNLLYFKLHEEYQNVLFKF